METNKKIAIVSMSVAAVWVMGLLSWIAFSYSHTPQIVAQCPAPQTIEKTVVQHDVALADGWTCDTPRLGQEDLLQPTGYWNMDNVMCFKLVTPISQWCVDHPKAECSDEQKRGDLDPK